MFARASLPVHPDTLYQLLDFLRESGSSLNLADATDEALRTWLSAARTRHDSSGAILHGYRWKQLFLPAGTRLRVWLRHEHGQAEIIGDELIYDGEPVSPNEYVRRCAGTHRNAWELISILLPGAPKWVPATVLRRQELVHQRAVTGGSAEPFAAPAPAGPPTPATADTPNAPLLPAASMPNTASHGDTPTRPAPVQKRWGERRAWNVAGRRETDMMPEPVILDH